MSSLGKSCIGSSEFGGQRKLRGSFWAGSARVLSRGAVYLSGDLGVRSTRFWCSRRDMWLVFSSGVGAGFRCGAECFLGSNGCGLHDGERKRAGRGTCDGVVKNIF